MYLLMFSFIFLPAKIISGRYLTQLTYELSSMGLPLYNAPQLVLVQNLLKFHFELAALSTSFVFLTPILSKIIDNSLIKAMLTSL